MLKAIFSTVLFTATCCSATAQITNQYKWKDRPPILQECDRLGDHIKGSKVPMDPYSYFWIANKKNADTVIAVLGLWAKVDKNGALNISDEKKFKELNITTEGINALNSFRTANTEANLFKVLESRKYFLVPVTALTADAIPVYDKGKQTQRLTIGAATLPFKLRVANFDFAKDLNIGSVIGINRRTHHEKNNFINYLFNISVSVNDIDNLAARNVPADQLPAKNIAALTLAGGVVWQSGKAQVGLFYGFDFMSHNNWTKYRWVYNKRPWVGIGFGLNIFQREDTNAGPGDEISNFNKKKKKTPGAVTIKAEGNNTEADNRNDNK